MPAYRVSAPSASRGLVDSLQWAHCPVDAGLTTVSKQVQEGERVMGFHRIFKSSLKGTIINVVYFQKT